MNGCSPCIPSGTAGSFRTRGVKDLGRKRKRERESGRGVREGDDPSGGVVACIFKYHVRDGELGFKGSSKVARSSLDFYSGGAPRREFGCRE